MEDRRQVDTLNVAQRVARLLAADHPEVRRRAAITAGRLADTRSIPLLLARPLDPDTAIAASVVWAIGQIRSPGSVVWLDSILTSAKTAPTVAAEFCHRARQDHGADGAGITRAISLPVRHSTHGPKRQSARRCFRSDGSPSAATSHRSSGGPHRRTTRSAGAPPGRWRASVIRPACQRSSAGRRTSRR